MSRPRDDAPVVSPYHQKNLGLSLRDGELGNKEQAFQWLNVAFQEHDNELTSIKTAFQLDPISDPRFAELVRKVGLPQ